jgi:hypothetical protein
LRLERVVTKPVAVMGDKARYRSRSRREMVMGVLRLAWGLNQVSTKVANLRIPSTAGRFLSS